MANEQEPSPEKVALVRAEVAPLLADPRYGRADGADLQQKVKRIYEKAYGTAPVEVSEGVTINTPFPRPAPVLGPEALESPEPLEGETPEAAAERVEAMKTLRAEWGADFASNWELTRSTVAELSRGHESLVSKIAGAAGNSAEMMRLVLDIAKRIRKY